MSDPKATEQSSPARREQLRVRIERLRQSRRRSVLGLPELIGLTASALMLLMVVFAYLFFLRPSYSRLDAAQLKREETYKQLRRYQENYKVDADKQVTVSEVNQSVMDFEANHLSSRSEGRLTLLDTLNKLIRSNGLRNTSGPSYTALDPLPSGALQSSTTRTGNARWQSLYPGIGINVTVEGPYPNLRRFVREIETGNQFIVINTVELEKASDSSAANSPGASPAARGSLVSLRLDMAAYFRREAQTTEAGLTPTAGQR